MAFDPDPRRPDSGASTLPDGGSHHESYLRLLAIAVPFQVHGA